MMRALLLLAVAMTAALPAAAQQAPPPSQPSAEPARPPERRPLNLRLDNPSSFATEAPAEKAPAKNLPTLGEDARKIERPVPLGQKSEGGPYPKDTNPNN